jgi:hypothetical protein
LNDTFFQSFRITKVYLQIPGIDRCPRFEGIEIPKKNDEFEIDGVKYYVKVRVFKPLERTLMIVLDLK